MLHFGRRALVLLMFQFGGQEVFLLAQLIRSFFSSQSRPLIINSM